MKLLFFILLLAAQCARAHIGSPNVFFDGKAGTHAVRVIIRPPAAIPGIAQIDIRTAAPGIKVRAVLLTAADEAAAAPIAATPVEGELSNAAIWLSRAGDYDIRVTVGSHELHIPLRAASLVRPQMPAGLRSALAISGALLILAAALIAGAAARQSTLAPTATPTIRDKRRGIRVAIATLALLVAATYAGTVRWRKMDADFRLYDPNGRTVARQRTSGEANYTVNFGMNGRVAQGVYLLSVQAKESQKIIRVVIF